MRQKIWKRLKTPYRWLSSRILTSYQHAVDSLQTDIRDGRRWVSAKSPQIIQVLVERFVGFWLALLVVTLLGWVGIMLVRSAALGFEIAILAEHGSLILNQVSAYGVLIVVMAGLQISGVLIVSLMRVLFWTRGKISEIWKKYTPPFKIEDSDLENELSKVPERQVKKAKDQALTHGVWGAIVFLVVSSTLLYLDQNHPDVLYDATSSSELTIVGDILNVAFWVIDVNAVVTTFVPESTQTAIIIFSLGFALPGVWFMLASKNLLFYTEALARDLFIGAKESGVLTRSGGLLIGIILYFLVSTVIAVVEILSAVKL